MVVYKYYLISSNEKLKYFCQRPKIQKETKDQSLNCVIIW